MISFQHRRTTGEILKRSGLSLCRHSSQRQPMDLFPQHHHQVGVVMGLLQKLCIKLNTSVILLVILACCVNGDRDRKLLLIADLFQTVETVHSRHIDVEKNVIRFFQNVGRENLQRILTIMRGNERYGGIDLFQCIIEDLDVVGIIIDEQDSQVRFRQGCQLIIRHNRRVEIAEKISNYLR